MSKTKYDPDKYDPAVKRKSDLKKKYGITQQEYEERLANQGHGCGICGASYTTSRNRGHFDVDHDHGTGTVRGILCRRCNMGLGYFSDDHALVQAADSYLTTSSFDIREWLL